MSISFYLSICSIHLSTCLFIYLPLSVYLSISYNLSISMSISIWYTGISHTETHTHIYIYIHTHSIYPMSTSKSLSVFCIYLVFGHPCEPGVWGSAADLPQVVCSGGGDGQRPKGGGNLCSAAEGGGAVSAVLHGWRLFGGRNWLQLASLG